MSFKKILLFTVGFSVCALAAGVYTTGSVADGWRTNGANDVMIKSNADACHRADSAGYDYFIPSRTPAEWSAVNANKPAGLAITACACEPLVVYACAVANGAGNRQCWSNGANWNACNTIACDVGYTLSGGVCVANPPPPPVYTYAYYTGMYGGDKYTLSMGHPGDPQLYRYRVLACRNTTLGTQDTSMTSANGGNTGACEAAGLPTDMGNGYYWQPDYLPGWDTTTYEGYNAGY